MSAAHKSGAKKSNSKVAAKKRVYKIVTDDEFDRNRLSAMWSQKFGRIFVNYDYDDTTTGPLIRATPEDTFTFGYKTNYNFDQKFKKKWSDEKCDMDGFTISWPAWSDRDGESETEAQRKYQEIHKEIVDWLADWLIEHGKEVGLHKSATKEMLLITLDGVLRYQKDKETKEEDHSKPPIFNSKVPSKEVGKTDKRAPKADEVPEEEEEEPEEEDSKKKPRKRKERYIPSGFIKDKNGDTIADPMEFLGRAAKGQLLNQYSSIYINSSKQPYLQVKLYEAVLDFFSGGDKPSLIGNLKRAAPKPLLPPKESVSNKEEDDDEPAEEKKSPAKEDSESGSIAGSDVDEDAPPKKSLLPKPVAPVKKAPAPRNIVSSVKAPPKPMVKKA